MTTSTLPPQVWRAFDILAQADEPPGSNYSPIALRVMRQLVRSPGATTEQLSRERPNRTQRRIERLEELGLVWNVDGRWWPTRNGSAFVMLIDREGVPS